MRRAPCPVRPEPPAGQAGNETGRDRWKPRPRLPCKAGGAMFGHLLSAAHRARTRFVGEQTEKNWKILFSRDSLSLFCARMASSWGHGCAFCECECVCEATAEADDCSLSLSLSCSLSNSLFSFPSPVYLLKPTFDQREARMFFYVCLSICL